MNYLLPRNAEPNHRRIGVTACRGGVFRPSLHRVGEKATKRPSELSPQFDTVAEAQRCALGLVDLPPQGMGLSLDELAEAGPSPEYVVRTLAAPYLVLGSGVRHCSGGGRQNHRAFLSVCLVAGSERVLGRHGSAEQAARAYNRFVKDNGYLWPLHPAGELPTERHDRGNLTGPGRESVFFPHGRDGVIRASLVTDGAWHPLTRDEVAGLGGQTVILHRHNPWFWSENLTRDSLLHWRDALGNPFGAGVLEHLLETSAKRD